MGHLAQILVDDRLILHRSLHSLSLLILTVTLEFFFDLLQNFLLKRNCLVVLLLPVSSKIELVCSIEVGESLFVELVVGNQRCHLVLKAQVKGSENLVELFNVVLHIQIYLKSISNNFSAIYQS